ncbi:NUDIX hydrolase [Streptomyces sp. 1222.5]|uniref:NUDIX hydrolase n=1 Tax=Streptomyces sp. 1222.5 TaxID=1881026 RepID=UPI003EBE481D
MTATTDLKPLAPLARVIADTVQQTPIRVGSPEGAVDLVEQLIIAVAAYMGSELPDTPGLARHMVEVDTERQRQLAAWGEQHHPDGTSGHNFRREADTARRSYEKAVRNETLTWFHIFRERFWTAMAETDTVRLRREWCSALP